MTEARLPAWSLSHSSTVGTRCQSTLGTRGGVVALFPRVRTPRTNAARRATALDDFGIALPLAESKRHRRIPEKNKKPVHSTLTPIWYIFHADSFKFVNEPIHRVGFQEKPSDGLARVAQSTNDTSDGKGWQKHRSTWVRWVAAPSHYLCNEGKNGRASISRRTWHLLQ